MAITKGDVLAYLQGLSSPSQISHRFVMGQNTFWPGLSNPDGWIPPLKAADGNITPGIVTSVWGELGCAEDDAHWFAGDNPGAQTVMRDAILGLIDYWNAGSLVSVIYIPASLVGPTDATSPAGTFLDCMHTNPWGRYDPRDQDANPGPIYFPWNVDAMIDGSWPCAQWREGTLVTGLPYSSILDYLYDDLKQLQDAGAVVIFGPFHEFDFATKLITNRAWWNMSGADFQKLWRYMHTYFTQTKSPPLTNLLWHWSLLQGESVNTGGLAYYPGDAYVDLVGCSYYSQYYTGDGTMVTLPAYDYFTVNKPSKPFLFGEIGFSSFGPTTAENINTVVESIKTTSPKAVGASFWYTIADNAGVAAGMANPWVQNAPVPILQLPPVANFTATQVPGTRTIQFEDTSI